MKSNCIFAVRNLLTNLTPESPKTISGVLILENMKNKECEKCKGKGWYFVNEWIGTLQGRKKCKCKQQ